MDISAPYWYVLSLFIFSSTRSPHIQARPQFKDLHFSKQLSLFGGEETDSEYSLQTANPHTASLWKGLSRTLDEAFRRLEDSSRLTAPHHAPHRQLQSPLRNADSQFTLTAYCMQHHPTFLKEDTYSTADLHGMSTMIDCAHLFTLYVILV